MARHLAICERKSAYPSRKEAKSAIVTHSMLDVLGLVRKPEEGPSGVKKSPPPIVNDKKAKEAVVVDNVVSLESHTEAERESKEADNKMETQEIVAVNVEESGKPDDAEEVEKSESEKQVADTNKEDEEVKQPNGETVSQTENTKTVDEEVTESNKEINKDESQVTEKETNEEDAEKKSEEVERVNNEHQERESGGKETNEAADTNSFELEKSKQPEFEITSPEQPTEKSETFESSAEKEPGQDSSEKQIIAEDETVKSSEEIPEETGRDQTAPVEEKICSPIPQEVPDEPPHEPYLAPTEKMSPAAEMDTVEGVQEKQNALDSEITSDDIQNIISDVVGGKSNTEMNFDDVQNIDETQSMEAETENLISHQMEDVNMQITRDESMEVLQNDAAMESVVTPMETD